MSAVNVEHQPEPVLRSVGLRKRFGNVEAMRHVDLVVHYGEIVGIVGDNGAGKFDLRQGGSRCSRARRWAPGDRREPRGVLFPA